MGLVTLARNRGKDKVNRGAEMLISVFKRLEIFLVVAYTCLWLFILRAATV